MPVAEALAADVRAVRRSGTRWGPPWGRPGSGSRGEVPAEWAGRRVEAVFDLGFVGDWPGNQAEALVHDLDGRPIKGIDPRNQYVPIANPAAGGERVGCLVEAAANPDILADGFVPDPARRQAHRGRRAALHASPRADLAVLDEEVWHLGLDLEVLRELMLELADARPAPARDPARPGARARRARPRRRRRHGGGGPRASWRPCSSRPAHASAHTISRGRPRAHRLRLAVAAARDRSARRPAPSPTSPRWPAEYPEFVFACSQAQQYAWVQGALPARCASGSRRPSKTGQWVPVGGMWVESDGNLPGGEALARQLVHGKRFFLDEFGVETEGVWLPDSFGYTAAYPQLARLAGMRLVPHPEDLLEPDQQVPAPHLLVGGHRRHPDLHPLPAGRHLQRHVRAARSWPTPCATSRTRAAAPARCCRSATATAAAARPARCWSAPGGCATWRARRGSRSSTRTTFFAAARAEYPDAPVWSGELYLELHRATYTRQARTKQGNRRSEHLLREAELWAATAALHAPGYDYPYEELDRLWKTVLLHQFHDILPGSSIAWVHREAEADVRAGARRSWRRSSPRRPRALLGDGDAAVGVQRQPRATAPRSSRDRGRRAAVHGRSRRRTARPPLDRPEPAPPGPVTRRRDRVLDNGLVRVEVDERRPAHLGARPASPAARCSPRAPRQPAAAAHRPPEPLGRLGHRPALPAPVHRPAPTPSRSPSSSAARCVGAVRVERAFGSARGSSRRSRLRAGSRRIDVETEIDWHEAEKILKAAFPLDVHADRTAAEIQFGHVHRPTHTNTSWEAARFEVCGHRWVHVGEPGYGVARASTTRPTATTSPARTRDDGGTTTTVRLSLVRAPRVPGPRGRPGHAPVHATRWCRARRSRDAVAEGYALNLPLRVVAGGTGGTASRWSRVGRRRLSRSRRSSWPTTAPATSSSGSTSPSAGGPRPAAPGVSRSRGAQVTDLLERPLEIPAPRLDPDGTVTLDLRPFQVLTVRLAR